MRREFGVERDSLQQSLDIATSLVEEKEREIENQRIEVNYHCLDEVQYSIMYCFIYLFLHDFR